MTKLTTRMHQGLPLRHGTFQGDERRVREVVHPQAGADLCRCQAVAFGRRCRDRGDCHSVE